jgi:hypothetical protein
LKFAAYVWIVYLAGLLPAIWWTAVNLQCCAMGIVVWGVWALAYMVIALGPMYWWSTRYRRSMTGQLAVIFGAPATATLVHAAIFLVVFGILGGRP